MSPLPSIHLRLARAHRFRNLVLVIRSELVGFTLLSAVVAAPVAAQERATLSDMHPADAYDQCVAQIDDNPEEAFEAALDWRDLDGGLPARHCVALALVALESYEAAAIRLEELADEMKGFPPDLLADVLGQAGRAWLLANELERAYAAATTGLQSDPNNVSLLVDRGEILATARSYWDALDDLNRALELSPNQLDALMFRAATYRLLDAAELAFEDIERALVIAPDRPEALVERGMLRRLQGDVEGARADWLKVLQVAPGSNAATIAQANIQRMELAAE